METLSYLILVCIITYFGIQLRLDIEERHPIILDIIALPTACFFAILFFPLYVLYIILKTFKVKVADDFEGFVSDTAGFPTIISALIGIELGKFVVSLF